MLHSLGWALLAGIGFVPALYAATTIFGLGAAVVNAVAGLVRPPISDDDGDDVTPSAHTRLAVVTGLACGAVELGLFVLAAATFNAQLPWFHAVGSATLSAAAWTFVFRRIPPWAGVSIAPAIVAGALGGAVGALLGGGLGALVGGLP